MMLISRNRRVTEVVLDDRRGERYLEVQALCAVCFRMSPFVRGDIRALSRRLATLGWRVSPLGRHTCPICASSDSGTYFCRHERRDDVRVDVLGADAVVASDVR